MKSEIMLSLIGLGILVSSRGSALVAAAALLASLLGWEQPPWFKDIVVCAVLARALFEYSASKLMDYMSKHAPEGDE